MLEHVATSYVLESSTSSEHVASTAWRRMRIEISDSQVCHFTVLDRLFLSFFRVH